MSESPDLYAEVAIIRDELEEQGTVIDALVRANDGGAFRAEVLAAMDNDPTLAEAHRLVDGSRSQAEILDLLRQRGLKGASARGISERMAKLQDLGLITLAAKRGHAKVYRRTRLDRAYGISRALDRAAA